MLKWILLAVFVAGVTMGTFSSGNGVAKSRFGCPPAGGGNNDNDGNVNENSSDGNSNENGSGNENSNSSANENGSGNANANANADENTNGSSNANTNGVANANENSSNSNVNDNGGDPGATINGRFAGTLTGTSVQSFNDTQGNPDPRRLLPSIQFEGAFTPVILQVLHYVDTTPGTGGEAAIVDASNLTNVLVGQTQTFNYSDAIGSVTLGVTVTNALYLTNRLQVELALTFNGVTNNLTRTGTGTQRIEGNLNGDGDLVVSIDVQYDIDLVTPSFSFESAETIELTGTLDRK